MIHIILLWAFEIEVEVGKAQTIGKDNLITLVAYWSSSLNSRMPHQNGDHPPPMFLQTPHLISTGGGNAPISMSRKSSH